jgi:hypothetical protein
VSTAKQPRRGTGARPAQRAASLEAEDAGEPILVLNCGSSSIKFALFDAKVFLVPRKPRWSGRIEGLGSTGVQLIEAGAAPVALALDGETPHHAAMQVVRACVERQTGQRPSPTESCMAATNTRHRSASTVRCWQT